MTELRRLAEGVHVVDAPQRFLGLPLGTRMTVLSLSGGLLVHSPVAMEPGQLESLGAPRWAVAPNRFHHLHVGGWIDAGYEAWAAPGVVDKRPDLRFAGTLGADAHPFGDEVSILPLSCFPISNEVVLLHRPSKTLVATDLVFHLQPSAPWSARLALRCIGGYPGCRTTVLERLGMRRDAARRDLATLLSWDFNRLVMAHGAVIETGGKQALREAFAWLDAPAELAP